MPKKTPIYLVSGLAADSQVFEFLAEFLDSYELYFLEWKIPLSSKESMANYAMRMCEDIKHKKPILIGVSFGGIMAQEMSKYIDAQKVIIISSIKSSKEIPKKFLFAKLTRIYKLFPTRIATNIEGYLPFFLGESLQKKASIYKKYISIKNKTYLNWAIFQVLNWQQEKPIEGVVHIHGTKDTVFPIRHIKNAIKIDNGTHAMILTKAREISNYIHQSAV